MPNKPRKPIAALIGELQSWLPNYDHGPADYPTLLWRILASIPGGDQAEDIGFEPFQLGWQEVSQLGRVLEAIQDKRDVEDLIAGLLADEEGEVEEARRRNPMARAREVARRSAPPVRARDQHGEDGDRWIINSLTDIRTYVSNANPGGVYGNSEAEEAMVRAIQAANHPPYGRDWSGWLNANVDALARKVVANLNGETHTPARRRR